MTKCVFLVQFKIVENFVEIHVHGPPIVMQISTKPIKCGINL